MNPTFLRVELLRMLRSTRFVIFTLAFPVMMFLLQSELFTKDVRDRSAAVGVIMVNMMAFGALSAGMSIAGKLVTERAGGWQRQLRLTPLSGPGYLAGKTVTGMLVALPAMILVPLVGFTVEGVRLDASAWLRIIVGLWLGAIPFVLLGLVVGQFATPDSLQPINLVTMMVLGFIGGLWVPIDAMPDWMHNISQVLPSYWLTQIGRGAVATELTVSLGAAAGVLAIWTAVLGLLVIRRYRKDSARA